MKKRKRIDLPSGPSPPRPQLLEEQRNAMRALQCSRKNLQIEGSPGCGKTFLTLNIAQHFSSQSRPILLLTFSSSLKTETRNRAKLDKLNNLYVHSYHSFVLHHYSSSLKQKGEQVTDMDIIELLSKPLRSQESNPSVPIHYAMILMDEEQDKTSIYYELTCKILKDNSFGPDVILVTLGDVEQNIYGYKGSDARFLTKSAELYPAQLSNHAWTSLRLQTSFRLTQPMVSLLNRTVCEHGRQLRALKPGPGPVEYHVCCPRYKVPLLIQDLLCNQGYVPQDIFVFAPSTGPRSTIAAISNAVAQLGIQVFVSQDVSSPNLDQVMAHKVAFLTYHKGKGLERKVVIVLNVDQQSDPAPSALFVALTRATEKLIIIRDHHQLPLPCFEQVEKQQQQHDDVAVCTDEDNCVIRYKTNGKKKKSADAVARFMLQDKFGVTELLKHRQVLELMDLCSCFEVSTISLPEEKSDIQHHLHLPSLMSTGEHTVEDVHDINGTVIPSLFQYARFGKCSVLDSLRWVWACAELKIAAKSQEMVNRLVIHDPDEEEQKLDLTTGDITWAATMWTSHLSGHHHRVQFLPHYEWLTEDVVENIVNRLELFLPTRTLPPIQYRFEVPLRARIIRYNEATKQDQEYYLCGCVDVIDLTNRVVIELKSTKNLMAEHQVQLGFYSYLMKNQVAHDWVDYSGLEEALDWSQFKFRLVNILNGHVLEIQPKPDQIDLLFPKALDYRLQLPKTLSDEDFLSKMNAIREYRCS